MAMAPEYQQLRPSMQYLIGLNNLVEPHVGEEIELDMNQIASQEESKEL